MFKRLTTTLLLVIAASINLSSPALADVYTEKCEKKWITKNDAKFAADCADMAFKGSLKERQRLAWMFFVRTNQLIKDSQNVSGSGRVPQWMAWATDTDTFAYKPSFKFEKVNRDDLRPVTKKKLIAGGVSMDEADGANEEVTRNVIGYDYITKTAMLNTKQGVVDYIQAGNRVDMPVGSVEIKASWLKVPPGGAPKGALTFKFTSGEYWWRGMHIMVKMQSLPKNKKLFYTETPSWFWTTFEFNDNPGVEHVRENFITQRAPLSKKAIDKLLTKGGINGYGFKAYTPNGTQIRFTNNADGKTPVILGHTDMEDFAGLPNTAQPSYWTSFNASCHSCHATASIKIGTDPDSSPYFPFTVPAGALTPQYYGADASGTNLYLGNGFIPLDFLWPIVFHAK